MKAWQRRSTTHSKERGTLNRRDGKMPKVFRLQLFRERLCYKSVNLHDNTERYCGQCWFTLSWLNLKRCFKAIGRNNTNTRNQFSCFSLPSCWNTIATHNANCRCRISCIQCSDTTVFSVLLPHSRPLDSGAWEQVHPENSAQCWTIVSSFVWNKLKKPQEERSVNSETHIHAK